MKNVRLSLIGSPLRAFQWAKNEQRTANETNTFRSWKQAEMENRDVDQQKIFVIKKHSLFLPRRMECRRGLAMRILSVCLSVCSSVKRVLCEKMVERSVQIFISYERSFRLIPASMTLNDLERRNSPYFAFFAEFDSFAGQLRHHGWRLTYNVVNIVPQFQSSTSGQN